MAVSDRAHVAGDPAPQPPTATDAQAGYIRGAGGVLDIRRTVRAVFVIVAVVLAALAVVLARETVDAMGRTDRLQHHGIARDATVTGCVGLASGTGITESGFTCSATFELDGRTYTDRIRGTQTLYATGAVVHGVVDPEHPRTLMLASALAGSPTSVTSFLPAATTVLLLIVWLTFGIWGSRRIRPPQRQHRQPRDL